MARVSWTATAVASLREIFEDIARDRPVTAFRTIESIIDRVASLATEPDSGQRYVYHPSGRVRQLSYGHFRVAYRVEEPGITVLGVFHGLIFLPLG